MTPEQRLDRAERLMTLLIRAGRRARHEWGEKVNILIDAQIATEQQLRETHQQIKETDQQIKETDKQVKTLSKELRSFVKNLGKGRNGSSSN